MVRARTPFSLSALGKGGVLDRVRSFGREARLQVREQFGGDHQPLSVPPKDSGLRPVYGDPGIPILGSTLNYLADPTGAAAEANERYGDIAWGRMLGVRMVSVQHPDAIHEVLVNRDRAFVNGPAWSYFIGPFFERGLMLLDGDEHLHHRRIMQQAFTRDRLVGYLKGMNAMFADGYRDWEPSKRFEFHPAFKQLTLDLAMVVFVGHHLGEEARALNRAFFDTVQAGTAGVRFAMPGGRWKKGLDGRVVLEDFFRRELPAKRSGNGDDMFTALCHATDEDGNTFTDDDVVNHMIFLLMAAHDTSTTSMTTLVYELARNPEWQERLREDSRALGTDHLEFEDMQRLPRHAMAIKEAQRIVAPVHKLARMAVEDTQVMGRHIPAGTRLGLDPYFVMRDERWWPDPQKFDPERFNDENRGDHSNAWIPFGGGVHKCIGMHFSNLEVTLAIHQLLLNFRWSVEPGYEMPLSLVSLAYPTDGLPIKLERI